MKSSAFQSAHTLNGKSLQLWRFAQWVVWLLGFALVASLVFYPQIGIPAFWNVLIPLAPLLFVIATGIWRNICPLATVAMLPHHLKFSAKRRLDLKSQGNLALCGTILLFLIVPVRHLSFDVDGLSTAMIIVALSLVAFFTGYLFDSKSGWCSGICPVHPVERLYGQQVLFSPPNAHCGNCHNCVIPCPDSTPNMHPMSAGQRKSQRMAALLITGGLPGFIIGWFHVPDCRPGTPGVSCLYAFGIPWLGLGLSLVMFMVLKRSLAKKHEQLTISLFAAAAVSAYYWYRIPSLIGYGLFPGDGQLVNLTRVVPEYAVFILQLLAVSFFMWWLVWRMRKPAVWALRPPFVKNH